MAKSLCKGALQAQQVGEPSRLAYAACHVNATYCICECGVYASCRIIHMLHTTPHTHTPCQMFSAKEPYGNRGLCQMSHCGTHMYTPHTHTPCQVSFAEEPYTNRALFKCALMTVASWTLVHTHTHAHTNCQVSSVKKPHRNRALFPHLPR